MEKYEDNDTAKTDQEIKELKESIDKLQNCTFLKNSDGFSKSMESSAIIQFVSGAPRLLDAYIRIIIRLPLIYSLVRVERTNRLPTHIPAYHLVCFYMFLHTQFIVVNLRDLK